MCCRVVVLGALMSVAFGFAPAADEKKADADTKAIQGTWAYESADWNGKKLAPDQIKMTTITFDGDKFTIRIGEKVTQSGTFKVDSASSPKAFDATVTEGEGKGGMLKAIYKLDGDTMTACINLAGSERPKEFASPDQSGWILVVAKRTKK